MKTFLLVSLLFAGTAAQAQQLQQDTLKVYKKRVLESTEIDFLTSYYTQDGDYAAVSGGIGTEKLTDFTPTFVVSLPLNADDVLTIDAGISAYSSASSSNVDPFDSGKASPYQASSGASSSDVWWGISSTYRHSSDDRNKIWSAKLSGAAEYDYLSFGAGGSYTRLFNEKNTELSLQGNVYLDTWHAVYPIELRPFAAGGDGLENSLFTSHLLTGNPDYSPSFTEFATKSRNSYSLGLGFSQILSRNLQVLLALDLVQQQGLLSTPFQRVYFADVANAYIDAFQLADDIERLPDSRFKVALGGRLNYFLNAVVVLRSYYRYYTDSWDIRSHTASLEVPVKVIDKLTLYPSYRFYSQTAAAYFAPYEMHLSSEAYYTSDYDLSKFNASQYGFGLTYTDIFTRFHLGRFGLKSADLKYLFYRRNIGLSSHILSAGLKFVVD